MTATDLPKLAGPDGRSARSNLGTPDTERYGIFVRPDPHTCRTQIQLHQILQRQYGLVAAAVFPPHATLLGNVAINCGENELLDRIGRAAAEFTPIRVHNTGLRRMGDGIACDIHHTTAGGINEQLVDLALLVESSLEGIRLRTDNDYLVGHTSAEQFHAHLTIAGQDLALRPDLFEEVLTYLLELDAEFPPNFTVEMVSLYQFNSSHWAARWWEDMTWRHIKSWPLH